MNHGDSSSPSSSRTKLKFKPKTPTRRQTRPAVPKTGVNDKNNKRNEEEGTAAQAAKLMNKFNENLMRKVPKVEKKAKVEVTLAPGAPSSASIRNYGFPKGENDGSSRSEGDEGNFVISTPSTAKVEGAIDQLPLKVIKQYKEPWDYHHSYYPTTLPLRRPYSGDPELLDEAEFGEAARNLEYDENAINPASDLGLLDECNDERLFFFQLPTKLPLVKRSATAKGKEKAERSMISESKNASVKTSFEELSEGYMGKMLVYKSGAVKLKLGDMLYDVSPGSECTFAQDVVAINTAAKSCCNIRELGKRAVVTPDIDSILNPVIDLD